MHQFPVMSDTINTKQAMKIRTLILVVGILLMAGFTALNIDEVLRPTTLNLGLSQVEAPLGLVMLGAVVVVLAFFLVALVFLQTSHLLELRRATKDANEQRQLADKAEQSRFTELRVFLQTQQQDELTREEVRANRSLARLAELETKLLTTLEQTANGLSASIGEVEDRLERQIQKMEQTSK
jgi:uncharacterized integral membrane protein